MSMIISIVHPDGIVMAADRARSRHIIAQDMNYLWALIQDKNLQKAVVDSHTNGDNLSFCYTNTEIKIQTFKNNIAVSSGGMWQTKGGSLNSHVDHFFNTHDFKTPREAAEALLEYIKTKHPNLKSGFHVCGYNPANGDTPPRPCMYFVNTLEYKLEAIGENGNTGIFQHAANNSMIEFSKALANNISGLTLQDMVEYAAFAIKSSAMYEKYVLSSNRIQGLDILVITPNKTEWVK